MRKPLFAIQTFPFILLQLHYHLLTCDLDNGCAEGISDAPVTKTCSVPVPVSPLRRWALTLHFRSTDFLRAPSASGLISFHTTPARPVLWYQCPSAKPSS
ncbi:hypothetical protein BDV97DRAFT_346774 [Delphinella strobiligena]|nr:hypothetical protein BDV97DRAFT_346774 [Delphinella strobiligena]